MVSLFGKQPCPIRTLLVALGVSLIASCENSAPLFPRSNEPMLYLILSADVRVPEPFDPESAQSAILATTGTATEFEYRTAEVFTLRRNGDDAAFTWRPTVPRFSGMGNYVLPETADQQGLGRLDLAPGQTYRLRVVTGGREITGVVTIPLRPLLTLQSLGTERRVVWPRVPGASLYIVEGVQVINPLPGITDTFVVVPPDAPGFENQVRVRITAIDSNFARSLRGGATIAGLQGAYGLFGAKSSGEIVFPANAR